MNENQNQTGEKKTFTRREKITLHWAKFYRKRDTQTK